MLAAAFEAFRQTFSPLLRGVLLKSMALALLLMLQANAYAARVLEERRVLRRLASET